MWQPKDEANMDENNMTWQVAELELRVQRQEEGQDVMNWTLYQQERRIVALEQRCAQLAERLQGVLERQGGAAQAVDDKPPHY
jgi:uncharacterized coiled-coil protein SlyX